MQQPGDHEERIQRLEQVCLDLSQQLGRIQGSISTVELLLKWVVLPLIVIVGGLVGIKIALPGV